MQDNATAYSVNSSVDVLGEFFGKQFISWRL
jgi:hypothetical protein